MADRLGQQFGNYRLVSLLGQGGYAEVYLGQHVRFNQQAAIKVLHAHLSGVEAEHFQQEAETIATLAHPSIVRVLDFDVQEGVPFLVMDYASGGTLPVIVSSVKPVAEALQYAHEQKFIHRDVKPENMLLGRRQEVLLSDFGIATIAHSTSSLSASAQGTSGTLAYMAPEQIEGHPRPASDQYALGVVVYEWLCGERPFEGSASELMAQHLSMPPLPLRERAPSIPPEVEQVVLRALAKEPKARFASVAAFSEALERASQRALASTAHHFSRVAPETILKSPENLNPQVVSGPFMMSESVPGDHYMLVRNPRYYRAREGLPYLDKVVFRIRADDTSVVLKELQAGTVDSTGVDVNQLQVYQRFTHYTLFTPPTSASFEALYFNFHNTILASHLEVRQAMAMAIDHQALIAAVPGGFATRLCTDHASAMHPGYQPTPPFCPIYDPKAASKLLEDNGWAKGADGVRAKGGQRLEFEYSTSATFKNIGRASAEVIIQRNLRTIGIQLDIQDYPHDTFFGPFLNGGKASPPRGAVAGRYDIAEWENGFIYDPDDASVLACDRIPPKGINFTFYCNRTLDALYRQEQATVDAGVRQQIFNQIHQIYLMEFPFIVLYSPLDFPIIVRKGTHNYQLSPFFGGEAFNIWEWWCDGGKC